MREEDPSSLTDFIQLGKKREQIGSVFNRRLDSVQPIQAPRKELTEDGFELPGVPAQLITAASIVDGNQNRRGGLSNFSLQSPHSTFEIPPIPVPSASSKAGAKSDGFPQTAKQIKMNFKRPRTESSYVSEEQEEEDEYHLRLHPDEHLVLIPHLPNVKALEK